MIIQKPSIFIYAYQPDSAILKEICAGIEEEGVFFEIKKMAHTSLEALAWDAANESMLGAGIGMVGNSIALQMRGLKKERSIESYEAPSHKECRKLGANSARAIKKLAFK